MKTDEVNRWIEYHGKISRAMTAERTALESALIPVTAYILIACIECYRRYPEMMREITGAASPEALGAAGRSPGSQIGAVHLWSIANFPLLGRQVLAPFGLVDLERDVPALGTVLDFWKRAAGAFRADGELQAWDAGLRVPRYGPDVVDALVAGSRPVGDEEREHVIRLNRVLTTFLFLLYFDTRAGYQDTGPYPLADGRVLLARDLNRFGVSHFPWSRDVCAGLPYSNVTFALVLDGGVRVTTTGAATSNTDPPDHLPHLPADGLYWNESWYFDFSRADGTGGYVRLGLYPNQRVAWYWAYIVSPELGLVVVRDHEVPLPRGDALEVRADGLWAECVCETPMEHWGLGLEAFGVRLDEPGDAYQGEIGER